MAKQHEYSDTARQIGSFLGKYPDAPLKVAVAFASVRGLAWLAKRTKHRQVTLLIGDCRPQHFAKATDEDRATATAFLKRKDVEVKNWYRRRTGRSEAHMKVWIVEAPDGPIALVGSANLTAAGLFRNREMVTQVCSPDLARVTREVDSLMSDAWDAKDRVLSRVNPPPAATPRKKQPTPQTARRRGCLAAMLQLVAGAVLLPATAAIVVWGIAG